MTLETDHDLIRVYDLDAEGYLRVERERRREGHSGTTIEIDTGRVDIEVLTAFPGDVPVIDLADCDDDLAAFGKELVA